jgi:hypothetical protein
MAKYTCEELAGHRITDLKATGLYPRPCEMCGKKIEGTVYRATLHKEGAPSFDVYVDEDCYQKLRCDSDVDAFAAIFGA